MIHLFPNVAGLDARMTRRQWLKLSAMAGGGLTPMVRNGLLSAKPEGARSAKGCIYIFLCGGPSQPDLWDLKPNAPAGVRSEFQAIQTNVPGIQFGELIPQVARYADKLALVRSMTHTNNDHVGAIVHSLLGQLPPQAGQFYIDRNDHPGLGGILHHALGGREPLPAWVVLPRHFETGSPAYKGQSAGFLGARYDPLCFDKERKGSLTDAPLRIGSLELPTGVDGNRLSSRYALRQLLNQNVEGAATVRAEGAYEQAYGLLTAPQTRGAFDLEREKPAVRDRYGRNEYGQSLLMARRLVESGVRFVNVFWTFFDTKGCQFNLWDNHGVPNDVCGIDGQLTGRQQITHRYCTPSFDQSFSALLDDLTERGMLSETLVAVAGEFGRTPKINNTSGRDHWAHCYTQLLAGGGIQGGSTWGSSDAQGAYVKDSPVTPDDFAATILHAFGLEPETAIPDMTGRPVRVTTGQPIIGLF
jgi:hypothetical protein